MRASKVVGLVLLMSLVSAPVWGQLSAEQAFQIAQRVKRDPAAPVDTYYRIVDRLVDDSTRIPPPLTQGPFAVAYYMGVKNADSHLPDVEDILINYYTGDVWALYDWWGHRERDQAWQGGPRLSRDQCYNIALNFVRQRFPDFDRRNMILTERADPWTRQNERGETIEDTTYEFGWYEIHPPSGALLPNWCEVEVWDVTGEVLLYLENVRTPRVSLFPLLTEEQALSIALEYIKVAHGVDPDDPLERELGLGLALMDSDLPGATRLLLYEDEFLTQRLVWSFLVIRTVGDWGHGGWHIGVDAHTGGIAYDEGLAGGGGGKGVRKIKKVPVPRQFACRPSLWKRGKLVLLVKGWEREPIELEPLTDKAGKVVNLPGMKVTKWRETPVWRKTELHRLNYPPLQRDGRHWLVVDYFKGFGGQVRWKGQQVEIVGKRGLVARRTPRWIRGKPYLPARVLEEVALARLWWDDKERALVVRLERHRFHRTPRVLAQRRDG